MSAADPPSDLPPDPPPDSADVDGMPPRPSSGEPGGATAPPPSALAGWARWTVERPVATIMIVIAVVVFGWVSLQRLPVDLMPDISRPTVTVRVLWEGAAPEEVEDAVVAPIEELVSTVDGLVGIRSVSRAGGGDVVLQFAWGTDLDRSTQKVRERIVMIEFPEGVQIPQVLRYDPALDPILRLAITGDLAADALRRYAEDEVERELEKIAGVAMVRVLGGDLEIVRVAVDERRLAAHGLAIADVIDRLRNENVNVAGGALIEGEIEYLVRTLNEFRTTDEIRDLVIAGEASRVIRLGDVATVERAVRDRTVMTRLDGQESIEIAVFKEADANLVAVAEAVKRAVFGSERATEVAPPPEEQGTARRGRGGRRGGRGRLPGLGGGGGGARAPVPLAAQAPDTVRIELLTDQSTYIRAAIDEVISTALLGGVFAVAVLFLFLRRGYATAIIGLVIPLSVLATFAPLRSLGVSLNVMSLGGLALGVGMLVDNAVVVLESIVRCREEGDGPVRAAIRGASEVGGAVVASTLTTVAVFLPIVFVEGVAGRLFGDLAIAVVLSLLASLVFALFFIPMLSVLPFRMVGGPRDEGEGVGRATWRERLRDALRLTTLTGAREDVAWAREVAAGGGMFGRVLRAPMLLLLLAWVLVRTLVMLPVEIVARLVLALALLAVVVLLGAARAVAWVARLVLRPVVIAFDWGFAALQRVYTAVLGLALRQRLLVLLVTGVLGYSAWTNSASLGWQLIPELHQGEFGATLKLPVGTRLATTTQMLARIESALEDEPTIRRVSAFAGRREDDIDASEQGEHYAELTILVPSGGNLQEAEERAMARLREVLATEPDLQFELTRPTLFSIASPVEVEIRGWRLDGLSRTAARVIDMARTVEGVEDVRSSAVTGYPEVIVAFDRDLLAIYGLDVRQVAETVRNKVQGSRVTEVRPEGRAIDVEVALRREDVSTVADLRSLVVSGERATSFGSAAGAGMGGMGGMGALGAAGMVPVAPGPAALTASGPVVTLGAVATIRVEEGPAEVRRIEGQRAALVTANTGILDLRATARALEDVVARVPLEPGQSIRVGGQNEELDAASASLFFALLLAIFLVYVVMASTFESFLGPLVILLTVPFALVGVVYGLVGASLPVSVVVFIGVIVLAGIVVNNAIVLVDYVIQLRRRGLGRHEAIVQACSIRLRPVLITATTTVLGLVPMALSDGEGAELRRPLAWVVGSGLGVSTLLTLIVVPVVYDLVVERGPRRESKAAPREELA